MHVIKLIPVWVLLTLMLTSGLTVHANGFSNFGAFFELTPVTHINVADSPFSHFMTDNGVQLAIANRIIAKVGQEVSIDFTQLGIGIEQQETLANLDRSRLELLYVSPGQSVFGVIQELASVGGIQFAQPDFLQVTSHRSFFGEQRADGPEGTIAPLAAFESTPGLIESEGQGVRIALIDDGFDLVHPAFQHTVTSFSYDVESRTPSAAPRLKGDKHGTMVAGILFADLPEIDLKGIAPQAELIAIRSTQNWTSDTLLALYLAYLADADVVNCSWGMPMLMEPMADLLSFMAQSGRNGLGLPVVFAAGNEGRTVERNESIQTYDTVISVSAVDDNNQAVGNTGPAVDIFAQGGIRTVDYRAYSRTVMLAKTSSAAPVVTGAIALLFSQHPDLSLENLRTALTTTTTPLSGDFEQQSGALDVQAVVTFLNARVNGPSSSQRFKPL